MDGDPVSGANVSLELWNETSKIMLYGMSDFRGVAEFYTHGPVGNYSYKARVIGYNATTETRNFTVNSTPRYEISPFGVTWTSISDKDTSYLEFSKVVLDKPPYEFRLTLPSDLQDLNITPVLFLRYSNLQLSSATLNFMEDNFYEEIVGEINGTEIIFKTYSIPNGNYSAFVALFESLNFLLPLSYSNRINLTLSYYK